ncbi:MAG: hypothetical protein KGJ23_05225 [Euryarchaeota archaeon]|nr:hypothetical protein [Euryarchaeota archaeon]MDE1836001.1 hypothetical protein [Euryarchaeota archaeon]MDE1880957.1 hypothetical protein [Euryarchaeota archaeon]MDE2046007.1 hypothetical protein [Thermoplasmata archaeon]
MRPQAVGAGIAFLIIGAVFLFVPFNGQSVGVETISPSTAPYVFFEPAYTPGALTFDVNAWSTTSVSVQVYSCGSDTSCSAGSQYKTASNLVAQGSGGNQQSFDLLFSGKAGTGYEVYASGSTVLDVTYNGPLFGGFVGALFAVLGVLALVGGILAKPKKAGARAAGFGGKAPIAAGTLAAVPGAPPPPAPPPPPSSSGAGLAGYSGGPPPGELRPPGGA